MISIVNASKTFQINKPNEFKALNNISFTVSDNEMIAVVGKSGAGKSTLLHIIANIDDFDKGAIFTIDDVEIANLNDRQRAQFRNKKIGFVFQDFALVPELTVYENIEIPLILSKIKKLDRIKAVNEALAMVGLGSFGKRDITDLSGGEKQRVAIARAIVNKPDIILADEPTGALDSKTGMEIFTLFKKLNKAGKTVIIITHDKELAALCDRIIEIKDGEILAL